MKQKTYLLNTNYFNIAAINRCTTSEGPYKRLAIWFQGCTFNCKGCCNPKLQKLEPANLLTLQDIIDEIKEAKRLFNIEGITLTGGEPTLQNNLTILCDEIRKMNIGIILFTGQLFNNLPKTLKKNIDTIIDGRFNTQQIDIDRKFIGSRNQKVYHITKRYSNDLFENLDKNAINVNIEHSIIINGDIF